MTLGRAGTVEITVRDAITVVHGMLFGGLLLLCFSGAAVWLWRAGEGPLTVTAQRALTRYLWVMAILAWTAVLLGAYAVYPWYRALPPAGTQELAGYPQRLLLASPTTAGWHALGMEWKEHIAWFAPICLTAAAALVGHYGAQLRSLSALRQALWGLWVAGFACAAVAGFFGAMLNKYAPVRGGGELVLLHVSAH
jgi:hypothetical protein